MKKAGRPSAYQKKYCEELIAHMREGADFKSFAGRVGVTESTIHLWKDAHKEFAEAYEIAKDACYAWWEKKSRQLKMGEVNVGLFVINMRNRFGWNTRDKAPEETDTEDKDAYSEIYMDWEKRKSER